MSTDAHDSIFTIEQSSEHIENLHLANEKTAWLDRWMEAASERFNPIVVKEARQALKSKQFLLTFILMLVVGLFWSFLGLAIAMQANSLEPDATILLAGYLIILGFPLTITIPFSTFRSMVSEQEDTTLDLVSITTLKPSQIVSGKLASALLQILIYVSILAPCILFTYMLRGIDISTIFLSLFGTVVVSISLCIVGLFMGTIAQSRFFQVGISIILILGLAFCYYMQAVGVVVLFNEVLNDISIKENVGPVIITSAMVIGSIALILLMVATSRLQFYTDNHTTKIRVAIVIQHILICAIGLWIAVIVQDALPLLITFYVAVGVSVVYASLSISESGILSERVRRSLPSSDFARTLFSWFVPGGGRAFVFFLGNVVAAAVFTLIASWVIENYLETESDMWNMDEPIFVFYTRMRGTTGSINSYTSFSCFFWCLVYTISYFVIFVGLARVTVESLRNYISPNQAFVFSFAVTVLILTVTTAIPLIIVLSVNTIWRDDFQFVQITNAFWTISAKTTGTNISDEVYFQLGIPSTAFFILLVNLRMAAKEIKQSAAVTPRRVREDELSNNS